MPSENAHMMVLHQIQLLYVVFDVLYKTYQPILLICERIPMSTIGLQMSAVRMLYDDEQKLRRQQKTAI